MPNFYLSENTNYISITGTAGSSWGNGEVTVKQETGIHPQLYFTYIKKKFGILETMRLQKNLKRIEKAFDVATQNGQTALAEKFINSLAIAGRESQMVAKGLKYFVERSDVTKYKYKIKGGHISDTQLKDYTRVIPENVQKKLNKVRDLFDGFVVFHYWNEMKEEDKKVMSDDEKQKMRDPILFGIIKENDRLYFIADWEDEYCDFTFDEIIDVLGKEDEEFEIKPVKNI